MKSCRNLPFHLYFAHNFPVYPKKSGTVIISIGRYCQLYYYFNQQILTFFDDFIPPTLSQSATFIMHLSPLHIISSPYTSLKTTPQTQCNFFDALKHSYQ